MNLSVDEQQMIAKFRHLDHERQKELLGFADLLLKKRELLVAEQQRGSAEDRCPLTSHEERPEASAEPIFTE